ncbi:MAG: peptide chain release factor N(5)-glutamine methyltransferase [Coriobacteriia bacterium]
MSQPVWTVGEAMDWTVRYFEEKDVPQPRVSAEWLLSAATGLSRIELYAYRERPLTGDERATLRESVKRRAEGMPLQYVTGEVPFRTLVLHVRPGVFIPRPETEVLVEVGLEHLRGTSGSRVALDLCTGAGAVAVSLARECEGLRVWATDVSAEAVEVALGNSLRSGVADRVSFLQGDLFEPLPSELRGRVELILSNPPYVPSEDLVDLPREVASYEPATALDGGLDGLDVVRRISAQAGAWLAPGGLLAIEVDSRTAGTAAAVLDESGFAGVFVRQDLTGRDRIVGGRQEAGT